MGFDLKRISHYRNALIGVAMIWIALAHSGIQFSSRVLTILKQWGYGGVDICLFASGIGCWFSLEKNPDNLNFLKRKIRKLFPTYLCFLIIWFPYRLITTDLPMQAVVGTVLGVQSFTGLGYSFNWYISFLLLIYLMAPYLKLLAQRTAVGKDQLKIIILLLLITIPFWTVHNLIIMVTRIPIFYVGLLFGKSIQQSRKLSFKYCVFLLLLTVIGVIALYHAEIHLPDKLWSHGLHWYPFLLITPGLCILLIYILEAFAQSKALRCIPSLMGKIGINSFEVYLVHIFLYTYILPQVAFPEAGIYKNLLWLATIPIIILGCILLKSGTKLLHKFTSKQ